MENGVLEGYHSPTLRMQRSQHSPQVPGMSPLRGCRRPSRRTFLSWPSWPALRARWASGTRKEQPASAMSTNYLLASRGRAPMPREMRFPFRRIVLCIVRTGRSAMPLTGMRRIHPSSCCCFHQRRRPTCTHPPHHPRTHAGSPALLSLSPCPLQTVLRPSCLFHPLTIASSAARAPGLA